MLRCPDCIVSQYPPICIAPVGDGTIHNVRVGLFVASGAIRCEPIGVSPTVPHNCRLSIREAHYGVSNSLEELGQCCLLSTPIGTQAGKVESNRLYRTAVTRTIRLWASSKAKRGRRPRRRKIVAPHSVHIPNPPASTAYTYRPLAVAPYASRTNR